MRNVPAMDTLLCLAQGPHRPPVGRMMLHNHAVAVFVSAGESPNKASVRLHGYRFTAVFPPLKDWPSEWHELVQSLMVPGASHV